jgi:hypothetical protein
MAKRVKLFHNQDMGNGIFFIKEIDSKIMSGRKRRFGLFKCKCGNEFETQLDNVRFGDTKSCGCSTISDRAEKIKTHGLSKHPLYPIYHSMIKRCYNEDDIGFKNYGGRGIKVCDRWKNNFLNFYTDLKDIFRTGLEINRIDNDGNYEPKNVNFVTHQINSSATRQVHRDNTSGYRGVGLSRGRYRAYITVSQKFKHIGTFKTKKEAAKAYNDYIDKNNLPHTKNIIE